MRLEFYLEPETGEPHIYRHGVAESEVEENVESKTITLRSALRELVKEGLVVRFGKGQKGSPFFYGHPNNPRSLVPSLGQEQGKLI